MESRRSYNLIISRRVLIVDEEGEFTWISPSMGFFIPISERSVRNASAPETRVDEE